MKYNLSDICDYVRGKVDVASLGYENYISTENMISNKGGITSASSLPCVAQTQSFQVGDVLVSNIRPYFKKIWFAEFNGGCSNDVLVLRAKDGISKKFLYYVLTDDTFFNYSMLTSKGTKMPRGDKAAIMKYEVPGFTYKEQEKIAKILEAFDKKIQLNSNINDNLEQQAQAIFKSWFIDYEPFNGKIPSTWKEYRLADFLPVVTGKKNANVSSDNGHYPFFSCSQNIAWTDNYSFEGNAILVAGNGDFNVKWYNGKFEAYQRTYVLIPYNPRYSSWLYYAVKYNLAKITSAARGSVIRFITKGNLENFSFLAPRELDKYEIIDTFSTINHAIEQRVQENYRLQALRDNLLPRLMSGEIDISDIKI